VPHKIHKAMKTKIIGSFLVLFALVATFAATPPTAFAEMTASVSISPGSGVPGCEDTSECWDPTEVKVDVGGKVTWTNDDSAGHTVTAGDLQVDANTVGKLLPNGFESPLFMSGGTFSHTFDVADKYPYFCLVHPWMVGTVIVQEAAGAGEDVMINIESQPAGAGESMTIDVKFVMMEGETEHVNYNIMATQDGQIVLDEQGVHDHDGVMSHTTMALSSAASGDNPVDVEVEFLGFGIDPPFTGPIGQMKDIKVVPEFGTIAVMILGVAIISIIAVTARSKVIPRL